MQLPLDGNAGLLKAYEDRNANLTSDAPA